MNDTPKKTFYLSPNLLRSLVGAIEDAIGDDIKAIIYGNGLKTTNCRPSLTWDLINRNLSHSLIPMCETTKFRRGPWDIFVFYDKKSQCVITLMREERFSGLCKNQSQRKHYLRLLAHLYNSNLQPKQQGLFDPLPVTPMDEEIAELAKKLEADINSNNNFIRHHVLILFKTVGFQLTQVRSVMVTPTLDIAVDSEQDLSQYIQANESVIVEKVVNPTSPENQPARGLALKPKALERKHNKLQTKHPDTTTQKLS